MPQIALPVSPKHPIVFELTNDRQRRLIKPPKLVIDTGANAIYWSYNLISNTTPTYGGEVIQVLGVNTGPITVSGTARNPRQLKRIYHWMRDYMTFAGTGERDETPILFKYPTRGWNFRVHIVDASGFDFGLTNQIANPWTVTMEVLEEDARALVESATMGQFNGKSLLDRSMMRASGLEEFSENFDFDPASKLLDPFATENIGDSGSEAGYRAYEQQFRTMGDNFQRMVGAWASGDFERWSFDSLRDPDSQFNKTSGDYWTEIFGTSSIKDLVGGSSGGGSTTEGGSSGGTVGDTSTRLGVVSAIKSVFEGIGVPARYAIASSLIESNLNPDARQPNGDYAVGLFQTFPLGAGGDKSYNRELRQAHENRGSKVTDSYTAEMQIKAASEWWNLPSKPARNNVDGWINYVTDRCQKPRNRDDYKGKMRARLSEADRLLENAANSESSSSGDSSSVNSDGKAKPLAGNLMINSRFGPRGGRMHEGLDLQGSLGQSIYSVCDGKVGIKSFNDGGWGNYITIKGGDAEWLYAHMKEPSHLQVGQSVRAGQKIGLVGSTGRSSGPHLHLEMHVPAFNNPQDPEPTIKSIYNNT